MLTTSELEALRLDAEDVLPDDATVERWSDGTFDPDDPGDTGEGWTVEVSTSGRVANVGERGRDRDVADRHDIAAPKVATLPYDTDVQVGDRVTVAGASMIARVVDRHSFSTATRVIGESEGADDV